MHWVITTTISTPFPKVLPYKYNDYGFELGGPVTIPKLFNGKDRFFFMVSDEWYSQVQYSQSSLTLPTKAELGGDLSGYTAKGTTVVPIYDPNTGNPDGTGRTQFQCNGVLNVICPARIDPISAKSQPIVLRFGSDARRHKQLHIPHSSTKGHSRRLQRARRFLNQSQKLQWAFRFSNGLETQLPPLALRRRGGTVGSKIITNYYQYMGSNTWTLSPTVVNVARIGWTNFYNSLGLYSQGSNDAVTKLGIPNLQPGISATWGIPAVSFTGDIFSGGGDSTDGPYA